MTGSSSKSDDVAGVLSTYRDVWNDFYEWEQEESRRLIKSLCRPKPDANTVVKGKGKSNALADEDAITPHSLTRNWTDKSSLQTIYSTDEVTSIHEQLVDIEFPEICIEAPPMTPSPVYEACAPIARNMFTGDDPENLAFFPYAANDKQFNLADYLSQYDSFAWQKRNIDPDRKPS